MGIKANTRPLIGIRGSERKLLLLTGDLIICLISLSVAIYVWAHDSAEYLGFSWTFVQERVPVWFFFLPVLWLLLLAELYDVRRSSRRSDTVGAIAIAVGISAILYLAAFFLAEPKSLPRLGVAVFFLSAAVGTMIWRMVYIRVFTGQPFMRRVLIVGAGRAGTALVNVIQGLKPAPFNLVGLIDDDPDKQGTSFADVPVLGTGDALINIIDMYNISDVIFAISGTMRTETFEALLEAEERGVEVTTMPIMYEELLGRVPIFLLQSDWILRSFVDQAHPSGVYEFGKRFLDVLGGLVGTIVVMALFPFISLLILIDSGLPVLFTQKRVGKNGKVYTIIKFRTMRNDPGGEARMTTTNDERITRVGRFLRKSHLDELLQFINVLRGEMSLVGPRPEQPELVQHFQERIPFYRARLFMKPGITGWAQVNQPVVTNIEETGIKLEYDLYYIKRRNLFLDISIILRTIGTVIGLRGL